MLLYGFVFSVVFDGALIYIFCVYAFFVKLVTKLTAIDKSSDDRSIDALFAKSRRAVATSFSKARRRFFEGVF